MLRILGGDLRWGRVLRSIRYDVRKFREMYYCSSCRNGVVLRLSVPRISCDSYVCTLKGEMIFFVGMLRLLL